MFAKQIFLTIKDYFKDCCNSLLIPSNYNYPIISFTNIIFYIFDFENEQIIFISKSQLSVTIIVYRIAEKYRFSLKRRTKIENSFIYKLLISTIIHWNRLLKLLIFELENIMIVLLVNNLNLISIGSCCYWNWQAGSSLEIIILNIKYSN